jgi:hypothetical protein
VRFDYGASVPWVVRGQRGLTLAAGPDAVHLATPVATRGEDALTAAEFAVAAGQRLPFALDWHPSHDGPPPPADAFRALEATQHSWQAWSKRCTYAGGWAESVLTSLVVRRGLTHADTGGTVAAPTTSLPETLGGVRNWDYRFCWVRDAALSLGALLQCGLPRRRWRSASGCCARPRATRATCGSCTASPASGASTGTLHASASAVQASVCTGGGPTPARDEPRASRGTASGRSLPQGEAGVRTRSGRALEHRLYE